MKRLLCLLMALVMSVSVFGAVFAEGDSAKAVIAEKEIKNIITFS